MHLFEEQEAPVLALAFVVCSPKTEPCVMKV